MKFHQWKIIVRGIWLDYWCFSLMKGDGTTSHVILGAKTGKPPFYFKDVSSVDNFISEQENKATLQKNTTKCKTFANLFRNQKWTKESWRSCSIAVYHFGQNQRWERIWAFFAPKSIGKFCYILLALKFRLFPLFEWIKLISLSYRC